MVHVADVVVVTLGFVAAIGAAILLRLLLLLLPRPSVLGTFAHFLDQVFQVVLVCIVQFLRQVVDVVLLIGIIGLPQRCHEAPVFELEQIFQAKQFSLSVVVFGDSAENFWLVLSVVGVAEGLLLELDLVDLASVHQLFDCATSHEPHDIDISLLPDPERSVLRLLVVAWVPIDIEDDDFVG